MTNGTTLLVQLREDFATHGRRWSLPGLHALVFYRIGRELIAARKDASFLQRAAIAPAWILYRLAATFARDVYGIEIPPQATIGRRVRFSHQHGTTVHHRAVIGDDCIIRHMVTLGAGVRGSGAAPVLGKRVEVSPGAVIIGKVRIGDNVKIGPNVVVMTHVPDGSTVVATPPRIMQLKSQEAPPGG